MQAGPITAPPASQHQPQLARCPDRTDCVVAAVARDVPVSDNADIAERIQRTLEASGYPELCSVLVIADDRAVLLQGNVSSYFLKQIAHETVRAALGERPLLNALRVLKSPNGQST